jgi:hypothetical protein
MRCKGVYAVQGFADHPCASEKKAPASGSRAMGENTGAYSQVIVRTGRRFTTPRSALCGSSP